MKVFRKRYGHSTLLSKFLLILFAVGTIIIFVTHILLLRLKEIRHVNNNFSNESISFNNSSLSVPPIQLPQESVVSLSITPLHALNVVIGAVVCRKPGDYGPREETSVMIKSIIISALVYKNVSMVTFHLFIEYLEDKEYFLTKIAEFGYSQTQREYNKLRVVLKLHSVVDAMPREYHEKMVYSPIRCAYIRCFFPTILYDVDSILYLDTDAIVTGNVAEIWSHLHKMKGDELIGAVMDFEPDNPNFDKVHDGAFGDIPIPTPKGLNSGVLLMNLTKMRDDKWVEKVLNLWHAYGSITILEDQRLINILLFYDSGLLHLLPCHYNFRPAACILGLYCNASKDDPFGIQIVHQYYHPQWIDEDTWNAFWEIAQIYQTINLTDTSLNLVLDLMMPIRNAYSEVAIANAEIHGKCNGILNKILFNKFFTD